MYERNKRFEIDKLFMLPKATRMRTSPKKEARRRLIAIEEHRRATPIERRMRLLKDLDTEVATLRQVAEYLIKAERGKLINSVEADFVRGAKESVGSILEHLLATREISRFDSLQERSLEVFIKKIREAENAAELNDAFNFFNRNSCILKLPARN